MRLNSGQIDMLACYFSDLSKALFISTVIGFFIPGTSHVVTVVSFTVGALSALLCVFISLALLKE